MNRILSLLFIFSLASSFIGCSKIDSHKDQEKILELEKLADETRNQLHSGNGKLDENVLKELGAAYIKFADDYPKAADSPEYLFRAGEVYSNELKDVPKAIKAFEKNYKQYPNHETAATALFFIGYLYNNSLQDYANAEKYYKEFIAKYPNHKMARDAEFELSSLGLSIDQVFDKFIRNDSINPDSASQHP